MRRILSRAAVLVGGAAAAWLLSTATASAETSGQDALKPVVDAVTASAPADPDAKQVKDFVDAVLPEPSAPPAELDELDEVGRQVQDAVEKVAAHLSLPATGDGLGSGSAPAKARLLTLGDGDTSSVNSVAANPQLAPAVSAVPEREAAHDWRRAAVAESPRHAPPVGDTAPDLPALPRLPLPMPLPGPVAPFGACNSCGNGGSNDDFGVAVAHTWPFSGSEFATSQALRLISQHVAPAAGEQPGVTPD
ncbi:hypothetical protein LWC34_20170 [Kibdelosporangium philippinense]|uniref:Secreted protein n=1 Tax=Kibdelosporangium philippinense TaxID=211113 RepID=A0ABS8ZE18_9PSEU|nr:hypothetical protein [Kibdelosporangium philippinense]MCE7005125.1 hypothetical protein [Kibdelosporangium philippinense]